MDFNYFYHREQVSRMRSEAAAHEGARTAHLELADAYGRLISWEKHRRVLAAAGEAGHAARS
ncbi:hypothetical protein [Allosphingosinicella sp.]|uniref:hypothetical protein n=1 Tax=Allosphingosinicella sp. TaxID=2823234 RepID=UPI003D71BE94